MDTRDVVPVVLLPPTTITGPGTFHSPAHVVGPHGGGRVSSWRGPLRGTAPTFGLRLEESTDGISWATCGGTAPDEDPGPVAEIEVVANPARPLLRAVVTLGGIAPVVSCSVVGGFVRRGE